MDVQILLIVIIEAAIVLANKQLQMDNAHGDQPRIIITICTELYK